MDPLIQTVQKIMRYLGRFWTLRGIADIKELKFKGVIILLKSCFLLLCEALSRKIHGDSLFGGGGGMGIELYFWKIQITQLSNCAKGPRLTQIPFIQVKNECKMNPVGEWLDLRVRQALTAMGARGFWDTRGASCHVGAHFAKIHHSAVHSFLICVLLFTRCTSIKILFKLLKEFEKTDILVQQQD